MKLRTASLAKGFTFIEVLMVLALLSIAAAASVVIGVDSIARSSAIAERDLAVTFLSSARAAALANHGESAHGLHISATEFVLFVGDTYDSADPENRPYARESAVSYAGPDDIVFAPLSADVLSGAGTLTFSDNSQSAEVSVNAAGGIDW